MRVQELRDSYTGNVILYCLICHSRFSATAGDYFLVDPDTILECCEEPLLCMRERTILEEVD